jgi:hypothetical protein
MKRERSNRHHRGISGGVFNDSWASTDRVGDLKYIRYAPFQWRAYKDVAKNNVVSQEGAPAFYYHYQSTFLFYRSSGFFPHEYKNNRGK